MAETFIPILIALLLIAIRALVDVNTLPEMSYPRMNYPTTVAEWAAEPYRSTALLMMKDCSSENRSGGRVALIPPNNPITQDLEIYFKQLNFDIIYFNNNSELDSYMLEPDYTGTTPEGIRKQICLGVSIDEFADSKYEYSLRYNVTSRNPDHWDTGVKPYRIRFKVDDLSYFYDFVQSGTMTLQFLIEGFILRREASGVTQNFGIKKMRTQAYEQAELASALEAPLIILFIIAGLIAYLRFISLIVEEREKRIIENMESMGMKKIDYMLAALSFTFTVHLVLGIILSAILAGGVLKNTNYMMILLIYIIFVYNLILIGSMISGFFVNTKKAVVAGLIIFFILYFFWILRDNLRDSGSGATIGISISPIGALSQIIVNLLTYENTAFKFGFDDLRVDIYNFKGSTFYAVGLIEIFLFFILGLYFFYVIPLEIGIPRHPLFFLGYPKKKEEEDVKPILNKSNSQILREKDDYEPVEQEFTDQRAEKKTLVIENLVKKYPNRKLAVNHLSIEMYSNQIFGLLGHNGAGKTTTISMISGFMNKTSGSINIFGYDSVIDKEKVKKLIGICPQVNPIFDFMTVDEHLRFYAKVKGVEHDINEEMDTILHDIDLFHKKKQQARNLSGGQKRKLCVAIAFIGGSKIILLDEPTSGMDTYARRFLWETIKKYKEDRLIILTTHNMDEADYLGDRIGIMSDGKMVTCGSSLYLKKKFGVGYDLTIVKKPESTPEISANIKETVLRFVPSSKIISNVGTEMKFRLPQDDSPKFPDLYFYLENHKDELYIENYGTGITTLEEVFLNVAANKNDEEDELDKTVNNGDNKHLDAKDSNPGKISINYSDVDNKDLAGLRLESTSKIFMMQMKALMKKRLIYFSRDVGGLICEIFLPIIIVILGLAITKINFIKNPLKLEITPAIYDNNFNINNYPDRGSSNDLLNFFKPDNYTANAISATSLDDFDKKIFEIRSDDQTYAYYLDSYTSSEFTYTAFFNNTAPYSPYIAVNQFNNAFLRYHTKNDNAYMKMNLNPLGITSGIRNLEATIDGFITVLLFALAYAFIPASMIVYIIKEREFNAKHQQLISGVNIYAYWLTNFIVDYIKYLIPALVTFALLFIFDVTFYTDGMKALMSLLLLLTFGWAMIAFVYVFSFAFRTPSSGQITIFVISFFASFVLVILTFALKLIESTRNFTTNVLEWILRLLPFFCFPYGFFNMANDKLYKLVYEWDDSPGPFSRRVSLLDLLYMLIIGGLLFASIILIENSYRFYMFFSRKSKKKIVNSYIDNENETIMDNDVKEEEERVNTDPSRYSVRVENLVKTYDTSTGALCCKNTKLNRAVKGITFGVEPGTVFGLLGTNGAGKSSTFKILTGDVYPTSGSAYIMQKKMPENLTSIRHLVGYCPQFDTIIQNLTTQEHLELYVKLKGINPKYHKYLIDQTIEMLNLQKYRNIQAGTYSGGNKRKLSVAIAMIGRPPIIFLDEPSSGMDPQARRFMWGVINDISTMRKHSTIIMTTHSMEEAEALVSKLAILVEGKVKTIGSVQQLKNKYGQCLEVEMKVELPSRQDIIDITDRMKELIGANYKDKLDKENVKTILEGLDKSRLKSEITETGKGKFIRSQLYKKGSVKASALAEWIDLTEKFEVIEDKLGQKFNAETLEIFQSFARFKMGAQNLLSEIFRYLETNHDTLKISTYSVKQISLEQIFLDFAKLNIHEE